jgi:sterol O-acyltransferase
MNFECVAVFLPFASFSCLPQGFFSLFWVSIFILTVQVYVRGIESHGRPLNLAFATMFSQDAITLALSDAALVLSTGLCIPIAIALKKRWIRYYWTGMIIQHTLQTAILFSAITWTFNRRVIAFSWLTLILIMSSCSEWPWVQSGFLTLHSLVSISNRRI